MYNLYPSDHPSFPDRNDGAGSPLKMGLRHKFVDSVFVKVLLLLFFQEKKWDLDRRPS
jgi:hypothetical protein